MEHSPHKIVKLTARVDSPSPADFPQFKSPWSGVVGPVIVGSQTLDGLGHERSRRSGGLGKSQHGHGLVRHHQQRLERCRELLVWHPGLQVRGAGLLVAHAITSVSAGLDHSLPRDAS